MTYNFHDFNGKGEHIRELIQQGKDLLNNLGDGDISPSAYDTAWVAMIPFDEDPTHPMFPESLRWILRNQFENGSWGTDSLEHYHDRIVCTLACIIALKKWNIGEEAIGKGEKYISETLPKLDMDAHDTVGFEVILPRHMNMAQDLGLSLPYDSPIVAEITKIGEYKLSKIPLKILYATHTTLLHSLEGLGDIIDCQKLMHLQADNGSFLNSPSATAFVYMETGDKKSLEYIQQMVDLFKGAAPVNYPIDIFERLWVINNIYSLHLERYFEDEIEPHLDYVESHWSDKGLVWSRYVQTPDIDDTAVAFKLLRLNGRRVSDTVFRNFYNGNNFFCFPGERDASLSHIISLRDTAEVNFGEDLLNEAEQFARQYLTEQLQSDTFSDKWYYRTNTRETVQFALEKKRFFKAPFIEKQRAIDIYRSTIECDYWIDKNIYTLPNVNSPIFYQIAMEENELMKERFAEEIDRLIAWALPRFPSVTRNHIFSTFFIACNIAPYIEESDTRVIISKICLWLFEVSDLLNDEDLTKEQVDSIAAIFTYDTWELMSKFDDVNMRRTLYVLSREMQDLFAEILPADADQVVAQQFKETLQETISLYLTKIFYLEPSFEMDYACLSIGAALALELTFFRSGDLSAEILMSQDYRDFIRTTHEVLQMLSDIRAYESNMEDGPTKEDAIKLLFKEFYEQSMQQVHVAALTPSHIPSKFKLLALDLCQTLACYYHQDRFQQYTQEIFKFVPVGEDMDIEAMVNLNGHAPLRTIQRQQENGRAPASALFDFTLKMHQLHASVPSSIRMQDQLNEQNLEFSETEQIDDAEIEQIDAKVHKPSSTQEPMLAKA